MPIALQTTSPSRRRVTGALWAALAAAVLVVPATADAVVGGRVAAEAELPSMAAVLSAEHAPDGTALGPVQRLMCGGVLIAPKVVLTAGHCVTSDSTGALDTSRARQVVLGRRDLRGSGGEVIDVARIVRHPLYSNRMLTFDFALLELAGPSTAPVARLGGRAVRLREGRRGTVAGWGLTSSTGQFSPVLRTTTLPLWTNRRCAASYRELHEPGLMLCAGSPRGGRDVCNGDSGGPLVVSDAAGRPRVMGVVSFGHAAGCASARYPTNFAWTTSPHTRTWVVRRAAALDSGDPDASAPAVTHIRRVADTLRYTLSEHAEVVVAVQRRRSRRELTTMPTALVQRGGAGENAMRLPPALRHALRRGGAYFVRVVATDNAGNLSVPKRVRLANR